MSSKKMAPLMPNQTIKVSLPQKAPPTPLGSTPHDGRLLWCSLRTRPRRPRAVRPCRAPLLPPRPATPSASAGTLVCCLLVSTKALPSPRTLLGVREAAPTEQGQGPVPPLSPLVQTLPALRACPRARRPPPAARAVFVIDSVDRVLLLTLMHLFDRFCDWRAVRF